MCTAASSIRNLYRSFSLLLFRNCTIFAGVAEESALADDDFVVDGAGDGEDPSATSYTADTPVAYSLVRRLDSCHDS